MPDSTISRGTGRRKTSIARVRLLNGSGSILVNSKPFETYFTTERDRKQVKAALVATETLDKFDVNAQVVGGGSPGQAGAISLGIARALKAHNIVYDPILRDRGLLTRDSRMRERKKYGKRGARRSVQYSKR